MAMLSVCLALKKGPAVRGKEGATHENQQAGYQPYGPVDSEVTDPLMSSVSVKRAVKN